MSVNMVSKHFGLRARIFLYSCDISILNLYLSQLLLQLSHNIMENSALVCPCVQIVELFMYCELISV